MSRASHLRMIISAFLLTVAMSAPAQQPINQARGYDPTAAYSSAGIDSVNLFGGNLSMAIPLGQRYVVSPTLSYAFTAVYNSHVWDFSKAWCVPGNGPVSGGITPLVAHWGNAAALTKVSNAGVGWSLTLGFLTVGGTGTRITGYVDAGGAEHVFYQNLHEDDTTGDSTYWYTRDGSYLRLHTNSSTYATVELPDGNTHSFLPSPVQGCTPTTCNWRLQQMTDRFNNSVSVTWNDSANPPTWVVSDSTGRSHTVTMGTSSNGIKRIASVRLATFGGSTALYSFSYPATDAQIDISDFQTPGCSGWPLTATATFLTGLQLPDGSSYSMVDANGVPTYYTTHVTPGNADTSGAINRLKLPTGGVTSWTYSGWTIPLGCQFGGLPDLVASLGVATRNLCDASGANCATWSYARPDAGPNDDLVTTTVTAPVANPPYPAGTGTGSDRVSNDTVYYFRTHSCSSGPTDYSAWDFGLPYTQSITDGAGHYLSSRSYQGSATSGTLMRSTYVAYEHDLLVGLTYPPGSYADTSPYCIGVILYWSQACVIALKAVAGTQLAGV
jgi:hypothetical protein